MQGTELQSLGQLISCRLKRGRAWVKLADAESSTVKVTAEEAEVDCFLRGVLQSHTAVQFSVSGCSGFAVSCGRVRGG